MSDDQFARVGRNEALYRQVNERIEDLHEAANELAGGFGIVCECGNLACAERIMISREAYERARANSAQFILRPGHEMPEVEGIVEREDEYFIVEKEPAAARRVAEDTDPRR